MDEKTAVGVGLAVVGSVAWLLRVVDHIRIRFSTLMQHRQVAMAHKKALLGVAKVQ